MQTESNVFFKESDQHGKTFLEVLAVLSIIGMLSLVSFVLYKRALQKKLVNDLLYTANVANVTVSHDIENKSFSDISQMNLFLESYTQFVDKYKISFYATTTSPSQKNFGINIEVSDGSNIPPEICKGLILGMRSQQALQAIDVKAGEKQKHIEAGTIDIDTICGK